MVERIQDRKLTIEQQGPLLENRETNKQYNNIEANKCDGEAVHVF
jgi:hypothetical protein